MRHDHRLPLIGPVSHEAFRKQPSGIGSALVGRHERRDQERNCLSKQLDEDHEFLINELNNQRSDIKSIASIAKKGPASLPKKARLQQPSLTRHPKVHASDSANKKRSVVREQEGDSPMPTRRFETMKRLEQLEGLPPRTNSKIKENRRERRPARPNRILEDIERRKEGYHRAEALQSFSSLDGSRMTSTIVNIDTEELCYCVAGKLL